MVAAEAADLALDAALLVCPLDPRRRELPTRTGSASAARRTGRSRPAGGPSAPASPPRSGCRTGSPRTRRRTTRTPRRAARGTPAGSRPATPDRTPRPRTTRASRTDEPSCAPPPDRPRASPQSTSAPTPGCVHLRDEHLPDRPAHRALARPHVLTHRRLRDLGAVLIDQPPPDPPRGVPLLARRLPIGLKPPVDQRPIRPQLRRRPTHRPPASPAAPATPTPASPPADEPHDRSANARIDSPSRSRSRLICSNCSILDPHPLWRLPLELDDGKQPRSCWSLRRSLLVVERACPREIRGASWRARPVSSAHPERGEASRSGRRRLPRRL